MNVISTRKHQRSRKFNNPSRREMRKKRGRKRKRMTDKKAPETSQSDSRLSHEELPGELLLGS